jgi:hypothetical protein
MSLLGKILTFLNVLAAVGFFMMAGMDWGRQQPWNEAKVERGLLVGAAIQMGGDDLLPESLGRIGLPLDEQEKDLEGNPRFKNLRQEALKRLFQSGGGELVRTQADEVKRVKAELQRRIDDQNVKEGTKAQKLADVLMHLATSVKEREELRQLALDEKNTEKLQGLFDQAFDDPLAGDAPPGPNGVPSAPPKHTADQRRLLIAHLLCATADVLRRDEAAPPPSFTESKAYQRALATTGLVACSREVEAEAVDLRNVFAEVRNGMGHDREAFLNAHRTLLARIEDLAEKVGQQKGKLKMQTEMVDKQRTLADARQAEATRLEKDLAAAREATREQLAIQAAMEKQLFRSRQEMRDAFEKNVQLERQLRSLEKGR